MHGMSQQGTAFGQHPSGIRLRSWSTSMCKGSGRDTLSLHTKQFHSGPLLHPHNICLMWHIKKAATDQIDPHQNLRVRYIRWLIIWRSMWHCRSVLN